MLLLVTELVLSTLHVITLIFIVIVTRHHHHTCSISPQAAADGTIYIPYMGVLCTMCVCVDNTCRLTHIRYLLEYTSHHPATAIYYGRMIMNHTGNYKSYWRGKFGK